MKSVGPALRVEVMHSIWKFACLCLIAAALSPPATAFAQSQPNPAQTEKPVPPPDGVLTSKNVDPKLFEPSNQKECDFPSPCGCDCDPSKGGPKTVKPDPRSPARR
jgi:hypothetical protein